MHQDRVTRLSLLSHKTIGKGPIIRHFERLFQMRAARYYGPGDIRIEQIPEPQPQIAW